MSAIHFDLTGDNDNIMAVVEETTKAFEHMADYMKELGDEGLDLSNSEKSIEIMGQLLDGLLGKMKDYGDELKDLQEKQKEAMLAGDTGAVKDIGDQMKQVAERLQEAKQQADEVSSILSTTGKGQEIIEKLPKDYGLLSPAVTKANSAFTSFFRTLIPGLTKLASFAGVATILRKVAVDATNMTQRIGDTWNREVSGWKNTYESFVRSIGSGKGFMEMMRDMSQAYVVGKKLYDLIDELAERNNSLTIQESRYNKEIEASRQIMMDSSKSYDERIEAAQNIIDKENELAQVRRTIAEQELEIANTKLEQETHMTDEEKEFFIAQYNQNKDLIKLAEQYGVQIKNLKDAEAERQNIASQMSYSVSGEEKAAELKKINDEIDTYNNRINRTSEEIKQAYEIMNKYAEGNDETFKAWADAVAKLNNVDTQNLRATRRAENTKNSVELQKEKAEQAYRDRKRQNRIKTEREIANNVLEQTQAEIDAMKDGNAKVLAQIDLDYKREKQTIQNWYDDLREEKIRKARELWEANPQNQGKVFTYNPNSSKWNATAEEEALFNAKNTAADKKYADKKLEGTNAADDTMNAYLKEYGSFWQKRQAIQKEYQDQIDATEDEWEKKRLARERDNELKSLSRNREYLAASREYTDQKYLIEQESQDQINDLKEKQVELEEQLTKAKEENNTEAVQSIETEIAQNKRQQEIITKNTEKSLEDLEEQYGDFYKKLAKDRSKWLLADTVDLLKDAEARLEKLGDESTADDDTLERIQRLKAEIAGLKKELQQSFTPQGILKTLLMPDEEGGGKSFSERIKSIKDAWKEMTAEQKWQVMGGYIAKIGDGLQQAADYMRQIAELTGNSKLADQADEIAAIGQNFQAAGQGAAQGGWIGAIVGGVSDMITQTIDAFQRVKLEEAEAAKNANDWADAIERAAIAVNSADFDTIFGKKSVSLGMAKYKEAIDTMGLYQQRLSELNTKYSEQEIKQYQNLSTGMAVFKLGTIFGIPIDDIIGSAVQVERNEYKALQDALAKGQTGLQNMLIKTKDVGGWARFWGKQDEYTSLGTLAPELWDENGELIVDRAKQFLEVNTQISDEQRQQIEQLIELKEGYDEAMKVVDETISETFGNLASDITDIIWDSVMTGADAWEQFQEVGSEAIANLGKQMIQEMLISEYLEQYREQMRAAYQLSDPEETQKALRNITASIFGGMEQMLAAGSLVAEEYKSWAEQNGFDLAELANDQQTVKAGGFETMSQDTATELNGRFTALQISNEMISQSAQEGLSYIITISDLVNVGNGVLSDIRNLHTLELAHLEDIVKYTKAMVAFGEKLDQIQENTSKL